MQIISSACVNQFSIKFWLTGSSQQDPAAIVHVLEVLNAGFVFWPNPPNPVEAVVAGNPPNMFRVGNVQNIRPTKSEAKLSKQRHQSFTVSIKRTVEFVKFKIDFLKHCKCILCQFASN